MVRATFEKVSLPKFESAKRGKPPANFVSFLRRYLADEHKAKKSKEFPGALPRWKLITPLQNCPHWGRKHVDVCCWSWDVVGKTHTVATAFAWRYNMTCMKTSLGN